VLCSRVAFAAYQRDVSLMATSRLKLLGQMRNQSTDRYQVRPDIRKPRFQGAADMHTLKL
jgi:hypothetical protein